MISPHQLVYKPLKNQIAIERLPKPSTSGMIILVSARVKPKDDRLFVATKLQFCHPAQGLVSSSCLHVPDPKIQNPFRGNGTKNILHSARSVRNKLCQLCLFTLEFESLNKCNCDFGLSALFVTVVFA